MTKTYRRMTCSNGHEEVRWNGDELPCFECGEPGGPVTVAHYSSSAARVTVTQRRAG